MPTYQYQCTDCGEALEVHQSFSDDALTVCPSCEGRLRKVFNAVGVVFKGSGFYRNDSRAASPSDTDSSSSSGSESSGSGTSSSNPANSGATGSGAESSGSSTAPATSPA